MNHPFVLVIYLLVTLSFTSCYSYRTNFKSSEREEFRTIEKPTAYIENADQHFFEAKILEKAALYNLTQDSLCDLKIHLNSITYGGDFACLTGFVVLLGQIPMKTPRRFTFSYQEKTGSMEEKIDYELEFYVRHWFWDILSPKKDIKNAIAKEMRHERVKIATNN